LFLHSLRSGSTTWPFLAAAVLALIYPALARWCGGLAAGVSPDINACARLLCACVHACRYFPTILVVLMAVFNDGAMIALSKDKVTPSHTPDRWNLNRIFVQGEHAPGINRRGAAGFEMPGCESNLALDQHVLRCVFCSAACSHCGPVFEVGTHGAGIFYGLFLTLSSWVLFYTATHKDFFANNIGMFSLNYEVGAACNSCVPSALHKSVA
jgi:hypothetical protein